MYAITSCPEGWRFLDDVAPAGNAGFSTPSSPVHGGSASALAPFSLHMQENRSAFPEAGRGALVALLGLCFAAAVLPALQGYYLVPVAVVLAMAALLFALESFARRPVPAETIEVDFDTVRLRDHLGRDAVLPAYWTRIETRRLGPCDVRLVLRSRERSIEIGRCISVDERKKVALLIGAALAHVRGGER